eukprot:SAG11_NODE_34298_length_272_cov_2.468208_1_plen_29_part_01
MRVSSLGKKCLVNYVSNFLADVADRSVRQ